MKLSDIVDVKQEKKINAFLVDLIRVYKKHGYYDVGDGEYGQVFMQGLNRKVTPDFDSFPYNMERDSILRILYSTGADNANKSVSEFIGFANELYSKAFRVVQIDRKNDPSVFYPGPSNSAYYTLECETFADGRVEYVLSCQALSADLKKQETRRVAVEI